MDIETEAMIKSLKEAPLSEPFALTDDKKHGIHVFKVNGCTLYYATMLNRDDRDKLYLITDSLAQYLGFGTFAMSLRHHLNIKEEVKMLSVRALERRLERYFERNLTKLKRK